MLTVPVAAIVTTASGTSYVTVAGAHGKRTEVRGHARPVGERLRPGDPGARSGALAAGDRVVVSG